MAEPRVLTGAIALIKSGGKIIGKMKSIRITENVRRVEVVGIGTILPSEAPVVGWAGQVSCSAMTVSFKNGIIPNAIRRTFDILNSQALTGVSSFEDQLVLDNDGVMLEVYEKVTDLIDPTTGIIKPMVIPFVVVRQVLIESDSLDITEGAISGSDQTFKYLKPILDN